MHYWYGTLLLGKPESEPSPEVTPEARHDAARIRYSPCTSLRVRVLKKDCQLPPVQGIPHFNLSPESQHPEGHLQAFRVKCDNGTIDTSSVYVPLKQPH